jgi:hypothetical protein
MSLDGVEVRLAHRGQTIRLVDSNVVNADTLPFLKKVSDWFEQSCVDQIPGYQQGETPSAIIEVGNGGGLARAALAYPLHARCQIMRNGEAVLAGDITRLSLGSSIELTMEDSGLSSPVPLRTSEAIDAYRESVPLPWGFGDLRASPQAVVQLSDTEFLWLDHASKVTAAQIDGQESQGWAYDVVADSSGHTYTRITFSAVIPVGAKVTACGLGMVHERTGELIENPADVIERILKRSAYVVTTRIAESLATLRGQCAAEGLRIAGRVAFPVTLRETLNVIMRSIGGLWSSECFTLYPAPQALLSLSSDMQAVLPGAVVTAMVAQNGSSYDVLDLRFDDQSYVAAHRQALKVRVKPSLGEGQMAKLLLAGWLRDPASAFGVAKRVLARASGEAYLLTIECSGAANGGLPVRQGDVVPVKSPRLPDGWWPVTIVAAERLGERYKLTAEWVKPQTGLRYDIVSRTTAGGITQLPGIEVAFANGVATLTIDDGAGKLLIGASVSLDGGAPKKTDSQGAVSFTAAIGTHTLYVSAPGYQPFSMSILVGA